MTTSNERVCEWDAIPNPQFNFWTIGNVSEVVPGVVRPLFATLFHDIDYQATRTLAELLDVTDLLPSYPPPLANFLNVFAGRYALNLAWANAIISTWQVSGSSGLMDQFITSTEGQDIKAQAHADTKRAQRTYERVEELRREAPAQVVRDHDELEALQTGERAHAQAHATMSEPELWQHIQELKHIDGTILMRHLLFSGTAGDYTDQLNKLLDRAVPGHDPGLIIALTSALRGVESAAPTKGAWDVARFIATRAALAEEVRRLAPHEVVERLREPTGADWRAFAERFGQFLAEYGYRGQREVDPSAADWSEEPTFAVSAVKAFLDAPEEKNPHVLEERAAQRREAIEAQIGPAIPANLRAEYERLLNGAQTFTRLREASKANWVRICRTLREPLRELGRRFSARGLIDAADDIFWLLQDEVVAATRGALASGASRDAVARRKQEAARLEQTELPEVFTPPITPTPRVAPRAESTVLTGMPVSAGVASGPARVVLSAEAAMETELEPGEVLVAPFTDAPWTPLFVPAAAVVVETGGLLSHASTVAREFGIPAVVAVKGATRLIQTGRRVTVDGVQGTVTLEA